MYFYHFDILIFHCSYSLVLYIKDLTNKKLKVSRRPSAVELEHVYPETPHIDN